MNTEMDSTVESAIEFLDQPLPVPETGAEDAVHSGAALASEVDLDSAIFGTFYLGSSEYALRAQQVREVVPFPEVVTAVPRASEGVLGLFSLRGEIVTLVDAATLLGVAAETESPAAGRRVAILISDEGPLGVVFDRTGEVVNARQSEVLPVRVHEPSGKNLVEGVLQLENGGRLLQILAPEALGAGTNISGAESRLEQGEGATEQVDSKLVIVRVEDFEIGFRIEDLVEIQEGLQRTSTQTYFEHCTGVVQLRGEVRATMDARSLFELTPGETPRKLLFMRSGGACVGLEVDEVVETASFDETQVMVVPQLNDRSHEDFLCGVVRLRENRHVLIADVHTLFERFQIAEAVRVFGVSQEAERSFEQEEEEEGSFFTFRVGETSLSFPLAEVCEVCELSEEAHLRGKGSEGVGLMDLRGAIVPLVDIGAKRDADTRPNVVLFETPSGPRGLIVDAVEDIVRGTTASVSKDHIVRADKRDEGLGNYISHATMVDQADGSSRLLVVLDPGRL